MFQQDCRHDLSHPCFFFAFPLGKDKGACRSLASGVVAIRYRSRHRVVSELIDGYFLSHRAAERGQYQSVVSIRLWQLFYTRVFSVGCSQSGRLDVFVFL